MTGKGRNVHQFLITMIIVFSVLTWTGAIWQLVQRTASLFESKLTGYALINMGILCGLFSMPITIAALLVK